MALLVVDAREGMTPPDRHFARWLRRAGKPVVLVANKAEKSGGWPNCAKPMPWGSATRCRCRPGTARAWANLYERLLPFAASPAEADRRGAERGATGERPLQLAIVGRPECRQVDPGQSPARRGPAADRTRARHHPRRDRDRVGLGRPAGPADRHRRDAPPGADRGAAGAAVGRRHAARGALRRHRGAGGRRAAAAGAPGSDDRQPGRRGGPGAGAGGQQMGSGARPRPGPGAAAREAGGQPAAAARASRWCRFRG